jgi:hypothetical protein
MTRVQLLPLTFGRESSRKRGPNVRGAALTTPVVLSTPALAHHPDGNGLAEALLDHAMDHWPVLLAVIAASIGLVLWRRRRAPTELR